jgi:hypothetical protein
MKEERRKKKDSRDSGRSRAVVVAVVVRLWYNSNEYKAARPGTGR